MATAVVTTYSQSHPMVCRDDIDDLCYRGSWLDAPNSKYASFQEIRYALAPTGDLRFKSPKKYMPSGIISIQVYVVQFSLVFNSMYFKIRYQAPMMWAMNQQCFAPK